MNLLVKVICNLYLSHFWEDSGDMSISKNILFTQHLSFLESYFDLFLLLLSLANIHKHIDDLIYVNLVNILALYRSKLISLLHF